MQYSTIISNNIIPTTRLEIYTFCKNINAEAKHVLIKINRVCKKKLIKPANCICLLITYLQSPNSHYYVNICKTNIVV